MRPQGGNQGYCARAAIVGREEGNANVRAVPKQIFSETSCSRGQGTSDKDKLTICDYVKRTSAAGNVITHYESARGKKRMRKRSKRGPETRRCTVHTVWQSRRVCGATEVGSGGAAKLAGSVEVSGTRKEGNWVVTNQYRIAIWEPQMTHIGLSCNRGPLPRPLVDLWFRVLLDGRWPVAGSHTTVSLKVGFGEANVLECSSTKKLYSSKRWGMKLDSCEFFFCALISSSSPSSQGISLAAASIHYALGTSPISAPVSLPD